MSGEVIFMNRNGQQHSTNGRGLQSFDGERVKPLSQPVRPAVKTDEQRRLEFEKWFKMKPIYFSTWMWEVACQREPHKYKMFLPVYQGQKVMLT